MREKKVLKKDFDQLQDDFWQFQEKFEQVCNLLGVGFTAEKTYPEARYLAPSERNRINKS